MSVLTPASRYAEPFLLRLAREPIGSCDLCIVHGPGSFGRQVAAGTEAIVRRLGIRTIRPSPGGAGQCSFRVILPFQPFEQGKHILAPAPNRVDVSSPDAAAHSSSRGQQRSSP